MDLMPRPVNFDSIWFGLKNVVQTLLLGDDVLNDAWNEKFFDVYHLCVSCQEPMGPRLHREIRNFIELYVQELYQQVTQVESRERHLKQYFRHWQNYSNAVEHLNLLFSFLNSHVVKKQKYSEVHIDFAQYGIDYEDHLFEVGEVALDIWQHQMIQPQANELVQLLLDEIKRDRMGEEVDRVVIKEIISSFVVLLKFKARNQLQLYEDLFEIPFFQASSKFFVEESRYLLETCDCSEFMKKILERMKSEESLSFRYLNPSSFTRLRLECRDRLLSDNVAYINSHCREMLRSEQWRDLGTMYELLSGLENGLELMVSDFEQHLQDAGLKQMQSLIQGNNLLTQFVESMLDLYQRYRDQIKIIFKNNSRFLSALDKACAVAVNYRPSPKANCKSPELLAKYCDKLLRRGSKATSEPELEESLNQVMILFNYIDDKDIFQRFYSRLLAKRLIFHLSISADAEEAMIGRLRQSCGYEYTRNLHRMFTDLTISSDLNAAFNQYIANDPRRKLSHNYSIQVLQADAWPISHSNLPAFNFPQELEKFIQEFEHYYKSQYNGRKLIWMYNLSLVELKFGYLSRSYLVTMEMLLMSVLLQFNNSDVMSYQELHDSCQIPTKELAKQIQLLIDSKILEMEGTLIETSTFQLNSNFTNKRTKFKILPINQAEVMHEEEQLMSSVEDDRRLLLQASIVRTMKARRELKHSALIEEVINQTKSRFVPRIGMIKKCIEVLVEKQYIERAPKSDNVYIYIA